MTSAILPVLLPWLKTTFNSTLQSCHTSNKITTLCNFVGGLLDNKSRQGPLIFTQNPTRGHETKLLVPTGPRSAVVSASDCGSEGLGFESHQSHVGFFGPGRLLPRAGSAMGPMGRLEPHSRASSTSRMRL